MKKYFAVILALALILLICGCGSTDQPSGTTDPASQTSGDQTETLPPITWMTLPEDRALTAKQYFVYNCETRAFLTVSGEQSEKIYPASVTKLFTAYVAMTHLSPDEVITAGSELELVIANSSVAEIEKGDKLTAEMLVEAMLLPSGNDAAYVLAAHVGRKLLNDASAGAEAASKRFVEEMNAQAKLLGMTGTNFANPDGIHKDNHYTTFADLAILGMLSMEEPTILRYTTVNQDAVTFESGAEKTWQNTNVIIDPESQYYVPCAIGLKTGQTPSAGSCLLSAFEYGDTTYLVGVFGCPEQEDRFADTLQLFNAAIAP